MKNFLQETLSQMINIDKTFKDIKAINIIRFCEETYSYETILNTDNMEEKHIKLLDFLYDNGYGGKNVEGIILFNDATWLSREEYDGSEWWRYNKAPTVNEVLTLDLA